MDTSETQVIEYFEQPELKRSVVFLIASVVVAICGCVALGMGVYSSIALSRGLPSTVGSMVANVLTLGGAGLLVILALAWLRESMELTGVLATLFAAAALVVLPPIVERILFQMSIPGVTSTATWTDVGWMALIAIVGGFVGAAYFLEVRRLRQVHERRIIPEVQVARKELPFIPPPETTPSVQ